MSLSTATDNARRIWVLTQHGSVEGKISLVPTARLLDELNQAGRAFLVVEPTRADLGRPLDGKRSIAINKNTILLVAELSKYVAQRRNHQGLARAPVALEIGSFSVCGFVHVPEGGDPLVRLNQAASFLAVTSASVIGPSIEYAAGFFAVNRRHVALAQRALFEPVAVTSVLSEAPRD
jgi:hypothetical protein